MCAFLAFGKEGIDRMSAARTRWKLTQSKISHRHVCNSLRSSFSCPLLGFRLRAARLPVTAYMQGYQSGHPTRTREWMKHWLFKSFHNYLHPVHHMQIPCVNTVTVNYWMWPNVYKPSCPHWITRYPPTHSGVNECGSCFVLSCWCPSSYEMHGLLFWIIE